MVLFIVYLSIISTLFILSTLTAHRRLSGKYQIRLVKDSKNSSNQVIFEKSKAEYEEALSKSGYSTKLSYTNNLSHNYNTSNRNSNSTFFSNNNTSKIRKRNIIWFNPPFSMNVKNNIGKTSYNLLTNTFPVLVSYMKYLTVILSKLVTVAHQISNKLSKDTMKS